MPVIYHTADLHIQTGPRWNECTRVLNAFVDRVEAERPDAVVVAGDVFERRSNPQEMQFAEQLFMRGAHVCPWVIIKGNHESPLEVECFRRLRAPHPIWAFEEPHVITVAGVAIACMPWPSKAGVITQAADLSLEQTSDDAIEHLRAILRWLGEELEATGLPSMLLCHAMVRGSRTAAGQPLTGCDFELGLEDLQLCRADAYALGHIHKSQSWQQGDAIFRYSGSPFHTDFGDWYEKSFSTWTFDSDSCMGMRAEMLPAHQMVEVKAEYRPQYVSLPGDNIQPAELVCFDAGDHFGERCNDPKDVEFKLTYTTAPEHAKAARAAAHAWRDEQIELGAYSVELNPQTEVTTRARAAEVATATTDDDKLREFWRSQGEDPNDILHVNMLDKFHTIAGQ
jgi:exonuclease SbcD